MFNLIEYSIFWNENLKINWLFNKHVLKLPTTYNGK
jgi:hypothetical protein